MWWSYSNGREGKARVQRDIAKRQKKGEAFEALAAPKGSGKLSKTFWGQAWCRNLESYQQYENRLPRGRSYLRQGNVYNLVIESGKLSAVVAGSELYVTQITIQPVAKANWKEIITACSGQVISMLDLLAGKLGEGMMAVLTDKERGLFPKPKEIHFNCSCPDHADMCKHVSAVLYGVGVLLDTKPDLLFTLRGVDQAELLTTASEATAAGLDASDGSGHGDLEGMDLSALFGIDLGSADTAAAPSPEEPVLPKKAPKKKATPPQRKKALNAAKKAAKKTLKKVAKKTAAKAKKAR